MAANQEAGPDPTARDAKTASGIGPVRSAASGDVSKSRMRRDRGPCRSLPSAGQWTPQSHDSMIRRVRLADHSKQTMPPGLPLSPRCSAFPTRKVGWTLDSRFEWYSGTCVDINTASQAEERYLKRVAIRAVLREGM